MWFLACAVLGLAALARVSSRLRGTTLVVPCWWFCGSLAALCAINAWLALRPAAVWHSHLRYAAAVTTFWPLVALLGARRPQDRAWQLVVLSLWIVLLLPAAEGILYSPETPLELSAAWQLFVLGLAAIGAANGLPTRRWRASILLLAGRLCLLAPSLSWASALVTGSRLDVTAAGAGLMIAGLLFDALLPPRRRPAHAIDRVWLDFRDTYGLLWGLRLAERFNAASRQLGWRIRLRWTGLDCEQGSRRIELPAETLAAARQNLEMLLRRFVSPEWFSSRWDERVL